MSTPSNIVALLPMKGHSERVPAKNFREFAGRPLFRWMLDKLLETPEIDTVVINTDARGLLEERGIRTEGKLLIRDRRPEICGDFVSMNCIIEDDLAAVPASAYLMTHTTNPLLSGDTVRRALKTFQQKRAEDVCDSLFTVNRMQTRFYRQNGEAINHDPNNLIRTQDLEPWFEENSNLYIFTAESFARTQARIGTKPILFETPRMESADIDDMDGWMMAEAIARTKAA